MKHGPICTDRLAAPTDRSHRQTPGEVVLTIDPVRKQRRPRKRNRSQHILGACTLRGAHHDLQIRTPAMFVQGVLASDCWFAVDW